MPYPISLEAIDKLSKLSGVASVFAMESSGFIVEGRRSEILDSDDIYNALPVLALEVARLNKQVRLLPLGHLKQQLVFFENGYALLVEKIPSEDLFIVVYASPSALTSEVRYVLSEATSKLYSQKS